LLWLGVPCGNQLLLPSDLNRKAALADYTTSRRNAGRVPSGLAFTPATPLPMQRDFKSIQNVSDPGSRLLPSHLDIVALQIANKSEMRGYRMTADTGPGPLGKRNALLAIAVGGGIAGTLDLLQACMLFEWDIPLVIAGGLLGRQAFQGGVGTYVLGVVLHFFIACSAAAVYYGASRKLVFLKEHPLVCGLFFGAAVEDVMRFIVLPLSALHAKGPYKLHDLILGLVVHMVVVGLPISFSVRRFAK